jgi:hypothetical protein
MGVVPTVKQINPRGPVAADDVLTLAARTWPAPSTPEA